MRSYLSIISGAIALIGLFAVSGCSETPEEIAKRRQPVDETSGFQLPEGLKDCSIHVIKNAYSSMRVVRCPNSQVTTLGSHKTDRPVATIENDAMAQPSAPASAPVEAPIPVGSPPYVTVNGKRYYPQPGVVQSDHAPGYIIVNAVPYYPR